MRSTDARDAEPYGFSNTEFDWNSYDKHRAGYPPGIWRLMFEHHRDGSNTYDHAMDLGCGSGIGAFHLASRFNNVIAADPSDFNLSHCRQNIEEASHQGKLLHPCQFTYITAPAEKCIVEPGSQDLLMMFSAIHWTNIPVAMDQIATALKPGGTVALAAYDCGSVVDNERVANAWDDLWHEFGKVVNMAPADSAERLAAQRLQNGYDCVPLDDDKWLPGARRIWINGNGKRADGFNAYGLRYSSMAPTSHVNYDRDSIEDVENLQGWSKLVDMQWIQGYMDTMQLPKMLSVPAFKDKWHVLEAAIEQAGRYVTINFSGCMILATRS